ncbi:MAG: hypothetical protein L3K15_07010 [Thermoplasmata archaeon]|nr:hypothetical protein [Thermoplasmata archaeon]
MSVNELVRIVVVDPVILKVGLVDDVLETDEEPPAAQLPKLMPESMVSVAVYEHDPLWEQNVTGPALV